MPRTSLRTTRRCLLGCLVVALAGCAASELPERLAGMARSRVARDAAGIAEVQRLHGPEIALRRGAVATYGEEAATLWVAEARGPRAAREMVRDMAARIGEGRSPFAPTGIRTMTGREVYELTGLGQRHFYFRSGARVVWLAADERLAEGALTEVLRFYP